MLPIPDMLKWLKAQGAELVVKHEDGMTVFRRSVSMANNKRVYWQSLELTKVEGGYSRERDTFILCDPPPDGAEEMKYE